MVQRTDSFLHFEIQSLQIYVLNNITFCKLLFLYVNYSSHRKCNNTGGNVFYFVTCLQ